MSAHSPISGHHRLHDIVAQFVQLGAPIIGLSVGLCIMPSSALADDCTTADAIDLVETPYTDRWQAYERLACLETSLIAHGDRRALFTSVYTLTTLRMAESIDEGVYEDNQWLSDYQVEFANHFRQAFYDWESGEHSHVPRAWRIAFTRAEAGDALIIQDVLLGMNAHINYDLPFAVETVDVGPDRASRYRDHTKVNDTLTGIVDEVEDALSEIYGSNYALIDAALGSADELLAGAGMVAARDKAWDHAVALTDSRWWNRWLVEDFIEFQAVGVAHLTLAPNLSPGLMTVLRAIEGSNPGSTFCDQFPCSNY